MAKGRLKKEIFKPKNENLPTFIILFSFLFFFVFVAGVIAETFRVDFSSTHSSAPQAKEIFAYTPPQNVNVPILIYHYVENIKDPNDTMRRSLDILPVVFDEQIRTLKGNGYSFMTPSEINEVLSGQKLLPPKPVIISFDDGYEDFYTDVLPILKKYNARAVAYVISGFLDQPNYMSRDQLSSVIDSKLVEVGCHTAHHIGLRDADLDVARSEIENCQEDLHRDFAFKPVSFAYPYGSYNENLFQILKETGLKNATTTNSGMSISFENIYEIPRIRPGIRIGTELVSFLEQESFISSSTKLSQ